MRYFPLYEAKMFHQFDHRWATFAGVDAAAVTEEEEELFEDEDGEEGAKDDKAKTRDVTLAEKQDPSYLPTPRYWVSEADVLLRAVPLSREEKKELERMDPEEVVQRLRPRAPKWLVAFRNIARSTDERSGIFSILPLVGCGNSAPVLGTGGGARHDLMFEAVLSSLVTDFGVRCKVGGTNFNAFYLEQMVLLSPDQFPQVETDRIVELALELVYTSEHLRPLAEACGCDGDPFPYDEARRALLRAELDALVARLYGLSRKQLRYILDPHGLSWAELEDLLDPSEDPTCSGPHLLPAEPAIDFPGETFRVLKDKEEKKYGEYRTRRLVLEAWDRLWTELGPVEPLPVRFGPNAPELAQEGRANYAAVESTPGRLLDVPVATGLFAPGTAEPGPAPSQPTPIPAPVSTPVALDDGEEEDEEDEEETFALVAPEPKPPTPLKDKEGRIIRVRVLGASGQEIIPSGTVIGSKKQGDVVTWTVLPDGSAEVRKFLAPPATLKRLKGS